MQPFTYFLARMISSWPNYNHQKKKTTRKGKQLF